MTAERLKIRRLGDPTMQFRVISNVACGLAGISLLSLSSYVRAEPEFFAGTGHWYEAVQVPEGITWNAANTNANLRGGYLCTVTDTNENAFVAGLVDQSFYSGVSIHGDILGPWLGGFRHANESTWHWVTDESLSFSNWYPGQPDGYGGSEQRIQFYAGTKVGPTWGDHPGDPITGYSLPRGYIVEYDSISRLSVARSQNAVTFSWPKSLTGWRVETTTSLSTIPVVWTPVSTNDLQFDSLTVHLTTTNKVGNAFFRLHQVEEPTP